MAAPAIPFNPPTLSAEKLHRFLLRAFRLGNQVRHKFLLGLLSMDREELFKKLGSSSIYAYAFKHFFMSPTQTKESLRVAKDLLVLSRTGEAFDRGEITWSHVMELTRIADRETEELWIEYARDHTVFEFRAEVQDAIADQRKVPRLDRYGLPAVWFPLSFQLNHEEHNLIEKAFSKVAMEMKEALGDGEATVQPKEVFLYMARGHLETDPEGTPRGRKEKEDCIHGILFHACPSCGVTHVQTSRGPAEVPPEHVLRVWADARKIVIRPEEEVEVRGEALVQGIDGPNTPAIVEKVLAREGHMCANPHCRRRLGLHVHHIVFRANGGPTALYNLVAVCRRCHGVIHAGLLEVFRDSHGRLKWVARSDGIVLDPGPEEEKLRAMPAPVPEVIPPEGETPGTAPPPEESLFVDEGVKPRPSSAAVPGRAGGQGGQPEGSGSLSAPAASPTASPAAAPAASPAAAPAAAPEKPSDQDQAVATAGPEDATPAGEGINQPSSPDGPDDRDDRDDR